MKQSTRVELACKSSPGFSCDCPHVLTILHHQSFFSRFIKYVFPPIDRPLFRRDAASRLQFSNTWLKQFLMCSVMGSIIENLILRLSLDSQ
jgi:hypothetical protein